MTCRSAFSAWIRVATSGPQALPGRASSRPLFDSPMQPRLLNSRSSGRRCRRDSVAFNTSGDRVSILGATSTVRPPPAGGAVPAGAPAGDAAPAGGAVAAGGVPGEVDGAPAGGAVPSSICFAAVSSFSCGNEMFTVTGTQAPTPPTSSVSASQRGPGLHVIIGQKTFE